MKHLWMERTGDQNSGNALIQKHAAQAPASNSRKSEQLMKPDLKEFNILEYVLSFSNYINMMFYDGLTYFTFIVTFHSDFACPDLFL